jgi:hypothetical protein
MSPYRKPEPPHRTPSPPSALPDRAALLAVLSFCALMCIARVVVAVLRDETFSAEPTLALLCALGLLKLLARTFSSRSRPR